MGVWVAEGAARERGPAGVGCWLVARRGRVGQPRSRVTAPAPFPAPGNCLTPANFAVAPADRLLRTSSGCSVETARMGRGARRALSTAGAIGAPGAERAGLAGRGASVGAFQDDAQFEAG